MNKFVISGIEINVSNTEEILSMGGPHVGDISIENEPILGKCLWNNFIYQEDFNLLFFVRYHKINFYSYFRINFYNLTNKTVYEFDRDFDMILLKGFINKNELEICHSFSDLPYKRQIFNLDDEEFFQVENQYQKTDIQN